jgi:hypothetical protein
MAADSQEMATTCDNNQIANGLDFILSHFSEQLFPRKISTFATENGQFKVDTREEALYFFERTPLDCKVCAFPYIKRWKGWGGKNRQKPDLLLIDKDLNNFKSRANLDNSLNNTLSRMKDKLGSNTYPSVLWTGHGYHIIQPLGAILLEEESEFDKFDNPSRGFLRFAEKYLSSDKADKCHNETMSFENCMLRIPSSLNAKSNQLVEVKIVQRWNGYRPSIKRILFPCYLHLQEMKTEKQEHKQSSSLAGVCKYWTARTK